ncbi:salivary glue protein Sgs-3-like isoform X1 [Haliotis rubra]|uniref:salivary glue protein Sgs-3-like isoform X1 n=1 Tax=Haliotis rubra TaxID=36100 RepID=UPI001EE5474B|nr:salivary glue protein Sgs-3-like isoform X1 [Haliotis rubra]
MLPFRTMKQYSRYFLGIVVACVFVYMCLFFVNPSTYNANRAVSPLANTSLHLITNKIVSEAKVDITTQLPSTIFQPTKPSSAKPNVTLTTPKPTLPKPVPKPLKNANRAVSPLANTSLHLITNKIVSEAKVDITTQLPSTTLQPTKPSSAKPNVTLTTPKPTLPKPVPKPLKRPPCYGGKIPKDKFELYNTSQPLEVTVVTAYFNLGRFQKDLATF